jgi:hypothetical protein
VLDPHDAVTIPLSAAFTFLALMCLLPDLEIRLRPSRRSAAARRANRAATGLFACAALSMVLVPLAPLLASIGFSWATSRHA